MHRIQIVYVFVQPSATFLMLAAGQLESLTNSKNFIAAIFIIIVPSTLPGLVAILATSTAVPGLIEILATSAAVPGLVEILATLVAVSGLIEILATSPACPA